MTQESSKTGGPGGPIAISDLLQMIDSQLLILTGIQESLMDGLQQVTLSIRELHGLRRRVEAGTSTTSTTAEPSDKPPVSMSKEDSSMSSSLLRQAMSGAENQDRPGTMIYDSLGNPYWIYSEYESLFNLPSFPETYRKLLNNLHKSPKTT